MTENDKEWLAALRSVRRLITHKNCMDGLATALVIRNLWPDIPITFLQHNTPEQEKLLVEPGLLFCDITPPRSRVAEFVEAGALVLDHHKHAEDVVAAFGERGRFADEKLNPGISGAVLAYKHIWWPMREALYEETGMYPNNRFSVCEFARLVGVRDTWQKEPASSWEAAQALHAILAHMPTSYWLELADAPSKALGMIEVGKQLLAEHSARVQEVADKGLIVQVGQVTWALAAARPELVSDLGELCRQRGINVLISFFQMIQEGEIKTVYSMRSDGSVDVGALAKSHGGGGHTRAAGFTADAVLWGPLTWFDILRNEVSLEPPTS